MAKITMLAQREKLTKESTDLLFLEMEKIYGEGNVSRTVDFQTFTVPVGTVVVPETGKTETLYGSVKFTLHKPDFDLEDKIDEYEEKVKVFQDREVARVVAKEKAEKDKKERADRKEKEKAEKEAKGA